MLGAANAVLATGAGAMLALKLNGLSRAVGEDRLEAMAAGVGEGELRSGVRALPPDGQARALRPAREVDQVGGLGNLAVLALGAILGERGDPALIGDSGDPLAHRLGQVKADREADSALVRPVEEVVRGAGGVATQDDLGLGCDVSRHFGGASEQLREGHHA